MPYLPPSPARPYLPLMSIVAGLLAWAALWVAYAPDAPPDTHCGPIPPRFEEEMDHVERAAQARLDAVVRDIGQLAVADPSSPRLAVIYVRLEIAEACLNNPLGCH